MLRTRFITAIIAAAILIPTIVYGQAAGVAILVAVLASIACWEVTRCLPGMDKPYSKAFVMASALATVYGFYALPFCFVSFVTVWLPLAVLLFHLFLFSRIGNTLDSVGQMIFVLFYTVVPLAHAIPIMRLENGTAWLLFILVVNSLGDAGAYFMGKYTGKIHFAKLVSPGKTVEGLVGGVLGNYLGMVIIKLCAYHIADWTFLLKVTLVAAIMGPLGDLCASVVKRRLGIKDYGHMMPGHGGVMDRADSLILVIPAVFYYLILSGAVSVK